MEADAGADRDAVEVTDPRQEAKEIATFMGGEWPERPERKLWCPRRRPIRLRGPHGADGVESNVTKGRCPAQARELFLEVYIEDIQDVYDEVMESVTPDDEQPRREPCHVGLGEEVQAPVDLARIQSHLRSLPGRVRPPGHRSRRMARGDARPSPNCWCTLDVAKFTELTAAMIVLTKIIYDDEGELPPEVEAKVIHTNAALLLRGHLNDAC